MCVPQQVREISACAPGIAEETNPKLKQRLESRGDTIRHRYLGAQGYLRNRIEVVNILLEGRVPKLGIELSTITEKIEPMRSFEGKNRDENVRGLKKIVLRGWILGASTDYEEDAAVHHLRVLLLRAVAKNFAKVDAKKARHILRNR